MVTRPALFLDRDGTINVDCVYIADPDLISLIPGSARAIRRAQDAGYLIVVVTNQSGVGRGLIAPDAIPRIHERLEKLLREEAGAAIDRYGICVHAPAENCGCRKPRPRLVREAAEALGIDLANSVFVGDKLTDVATGRRSGCGRSILVRTGKGSDEETKAGNAPDEERPDYVADDLAAAVDWVLAGR
ncbi:MAG: HAD family hydrolase [Bdellovibrionales bacterium]|nr:HAD family hydrolase [Bdellovibrionales bacterium]